MLPMLCSLTLPHHFQITLLPMEWYLPIPQYFNSIWFLIVWSQTFPNSLMRMLFSTFTKHFHSTLFPMLWNQNVVDSNFTINFPFNSVPMVRSLHLPKYFHSTLLLMVWSLNLPQYLRNILLPTFWSLHLPQHFQSNLLPILWSLPSLKHFRSPCSLRCVF
jgi:hypothetical protein